MWTETRYLSEVRGALRPATLSVSHEQLNLAYEISQCPTYAFSIHLYQLHLLIIFVSLCHRDAQKSPWLPQTCSTKMLLHQFPQLITFFVWVFWFRSPRKEISLAQDSVFFCFVFLKNFILKNSQLNSLILHIQLNTFW